jgi:hypothetical protein
VSWFNVLLHICVTVYILGYENTQLSTIDELLPTEGRWAQKKQMQEAKVLFFYSLCIQKISKK